MPPKPNGKGMKARRLALSVSFAKVARNSVGCKHVPVTLTQALDESLAADEPVSGQVPVSDQLETMTHMLVDL